MHEFIKLLSAHTALNQNIETLILFRDVILVFSKSVILQSALLFVCDTVHLFHMNLIVLPLLLPLSLPPAAATLHCVSKKRY